MPSPPTPRATSSSLRGEPGSVWPLPAAVDALAEAARQSGRPSGIWLAGLGYQFLNLGWTFGATVAIPVVQRALPDLFEQEWIRVRPVVGRDLLSLVAELGPGVLIVLLPLVLVFFRLVSGLARLSPAGRWEAARSARGTVRLRSAWREGRGLGPPALFLWTQIVLMMLGATLLFLGPTQLIVGMLDWSVLSPLTGVLAGIATALMLVYSFLLSILFQIALHSLVRNRRGVGSALLHAWRIARNDPRATARATVVDAVLYFTVMLLAGAIAVVVSTVLPPDDLQRALVFVPVLVLDGFAGCTRCAYWGRAYQALGGLSTIDDAPGA